ncbi:hypothetical protein [Kocuria marina]|uniref:hypothetical protein n=1 Tax=Kocuria marina TaxID=223184 RepID=UPI0016435787|nr:hypothetical protein [Kocuria indica]
MASDQASQLGQTFGVHVRRAREHAVNVGDVVLLETNGLSGIEPDPLITDSTIYIDPECALDQLYWQYASAMQNRLDAKEPADGLSGAAEILRPGENRVWATR